MKEEYDNKRITDKEFWAIIVIGCIVFALLIIGYCSMGYCQVIQPAINVNALCKAIYYAEGGSEATYLYGIRSVKYDSKEEAREICIRTIKNNIRRYRDYGFRRFGSYLEFLGSRYAPLEANNDSQGLNQNWIRNVRRLYKKYTGDTI